MRREPALHSAAGAAAPGQLRAREWWQVLLRAARHVGATRLPLLCAGIAFFAVLSIAPVLVTALSVYGAVNTPDEALRQLGQVTDMLPRELQPVVADQLTTITTASAQVLTVRGFTGLLIALWTATTAMSSLIDAVTLAYHETETRSFLRRTGLAISFVLGGAVLLAALAVLGGVVSRLLDGAPPLIVAWAPAAVWLALAGMMIGVLDVLYRIAPDRRQARWRWLTWGAAGATVLWVATSAGLFAYVGRLGTYQSTYGSLAGVAISMFWVWLTVLLVVVGAAVNGESERQTRVDSTVGPPRPLGERGAVVADTLPPTTNDE